MSPAQKRLRELRDRQSRERGRMAELSVVDELNDEQRQELDTIEKGTPDLERQLRAAQVAVDAEQEGERRAVSPEDDAEARELRELRSKIKLGSYVAAAVEQRAADGAELEYNQARGIAGNRFPAGASGASGRGTGHDRHRYRHPAAPLARPAVCRHGGAGAGHHDGKR